MLTATGAQGARSGHILHRRTKRPQPPCDGANRNGGSSVSQGGESCGPGHSQLQNRTRVTRRSGGLAEVWDSEAPGKPLIHSNDVRVLGPCGDRPEDPARPTAQSSGTVPSHRLGQALATRAEPAQHSPPSPSPHPGRLVAQVDKAPAAGAREHRTYTLECLGTPTHYCPRGDGRLGARNTSGGASGH